jgi:glycosyltransferase involved in cell wall biosynthesis
MVRIAFAMYHTGLAGGVRAIFEVANRLSEKNYDVHIVALGGDHSWFKVKVPIHYVEVPRLLNFSIKAYKSFKHMRFKGIKTNYFDVYKFAEKLGFHADLVRALAEALIDLKPDAAIATWYPTALSIWLSGAGRPFFFMQDFPELVQENDGVYGLRLFEAVLRLSFHFLANSTFTRDIILSYNREAKVTVTGVGVDLDTFHLRNTRIVNSCGKPIVMAIIRGARFKGGDVALKALNIINGKLPIHVILVGEYYTVNRLFSKVKPEFTYTLFRNVDDETLAKLYSSSDIFIFTSYREGFGLPPLEAMACGTAVVTTDCGGNRDYAVNGYNTLIVPPGDPKAVAEATLKILRDNELRERLVKNGMETAKQWTWNKVVNKFEEAIKGQ